MHAGEKKTQNLQSLRSRNSPCSCSPFHSYFPPVLLRNCKTWKVKMKRRPEWRQHRRARTGPGVPRLPGPLIKAKRGSLSGTGPSLSKAWMPWLLWEKKATMKWANGGWLVTWLVRWMPQSLFWDLLTKLQIGRYVLRFLHGGRELIFFSYVSMRL